MSSTTEIETGTLLGKRYRVLGRLGAGGMATVLLAEDTVLGRRVAVKRLDSTGPRENAKRFRREAHLGASLNHPNIVTVFDTLTVEDGTMIVMEYVPGKPLSDVIAGGPLEPDRALEVLRSVADALDHAHSHGVVHRDVKPQNVLLREDGVVKLVDLGVARAAHVSQITTTRNVVGTIDYLAPERLEGDPGGPAADVYSLAAVAFETLSGERAQPRGTAFEVLNRIANEPPPDLRKAWPEAPPAAARALERGLDPRPERRPESAGRLVTELSAALRLGAGAAPAAGAGRALPSRLPARTVPGREITVPARAAVLIALAATAVAGLAALVIALSSGGGEEPIGGGDGAATATAGKRGSDADRPATEEHREGATGSGGEAVPGPAPGSGDPATGAALNDQGYALTQQARYDQAVPILRRAVASFPEGTADLNYAYALYNLGHALRLSGRADEAIPILERRLQIPNQIPVVRQELLAARADASG